MKKILILFTAVLLLGCDIRNEGPNFTLEIMEIQTVDVPEEFIFGEIHEISMTYTRPNECYEFNDFIVTPEGNTRSVAIVDTVYNDTCTQSSETVTVSFDFRVTSLEPYIFQFYQGDGSGGNDQYLIVEIPVVE